MVKSNSKTKNLYLFLLVWMTFVNFTFSIPSLGYRYMYISYPIIAYIWLMNFKDVKYNNIIYFVPFVFFMHLYNLIGHYLTVLEPYFFYSSPFYLIYKYLI